MTTAPTSAPPVAGVGSDVEMEIDDEEKEQKVASLQESKDEGLKEREEENVKAEVKTEEVAAAESSTATEK